MQKRNLGHSDIQIVPLGFGGNVFGWTADEATSFSLLDALTDAGLDFIDTADVYSAWAPGHTGGESETIIGKWFKQSGKRDKVVVATKIGMLKGREGLSATNVRAAVEDSLRRLQTDRVDVYFSHKDDLGTPLEETLGAYQDLIKAGMVRVIGASNHSAERLVQAARVAQQHRLPGYEVLQPEYNLYARADYEQKLQPTVQELGLGVVTYYSLASGFLTGKYRSEADLNQSPRGSRLGTYFNPRGKRILAALDEVGEQHNEKPAAVALAWLIAQPTITAPLASATSVRQLESLCAATRLNLSTDDITRLTDASAY
ncbi:aldo/keto reductase [Paraburkholderia sp. RL17-337-BIB-A]|uniref:aldo/keto reductase n=1 Tax=Paraburkholderia sp. RL17-337-BIB-A TaxID=3031636 RepID=UPI0038BB9FA8